jgi:serine/threonine protein kinase
MKAARDCCDVEADVSRPTCPPLVQKKNFSYPHAGEPPLTLSAGTRLGPYEVLSPLGAGGMGEVYHARDTRLGRDVAIKVLPQRLALSPDARQRFEREADRCSPSIRSPPIAWLKGGERRA